MPPLSRRLAVAVITLIATGTGTAPALASAKAPLAASANAKTRLAETIATDDRLIHVRITDQDAGDLGSDGFACGQYARIVARVPADRAQRTAKAEWIKGVFAQEVGVFEFNHGFISSPGNTPADRHREITQGIAKLERSNDLIANANKLLGIHFSAPSAELVNHHF